MMERPNRKSTRLGVHDYSEPGAYFVTICTKDKQKILGDVVGATIGRPPKIILSRYGQMVDDAILNIPHHYPMITVDKYVVMPNHIHILLQIHTDMNGRAMPAPTISTVVQQMKGYVTKQAGISFWQKLFYDHIIRDRCDYDAIWRYIDENPAKWNEDEFFVK